MVGTSPIKISMNEIKKTCKQPKNEKAPGPRELPAELFKYRPDRWHTTWK